MGTNSLSPKSIRKLAKQTGISIVRAWACGGTDHTIIILASDGSAVELRKDGSVVPVPRASVPL